METLTGFRSPLAGVEKAEVFQRDPGVSGPSGTISGDDKINYDASRRSIRNVLASSDPLSRSPRAQLTNTDNDLYCAVFTETGLIALTIIPDIISITCQVLSRCQNTLHPMEFSGGSIGLPSMKGLGLG